MASIHDHVKSNKRRSYLLIGVFVGFVLLVTCAINFLNGGGTIGLIIALIVTLFSTVTAYWTSDKVALSMSQAQPADPIQYNQFHNIMEGLCIAGGLPKPRLYIVNDPAPNAFATGRNPQNAAVAVTTGLLERMNRTELEGVLAHELSHIKNSDILVSTIAVTMTGVVTLLSDFGLRFMFWGRNNRNSNNNSSNGIGIILVILAFVLVILSPIIAKIMQSAISRDRESLADITAVQLTRYPRGLISALQKLQEDQTVVTTASRATAHLWIESPLARTKEEGSFSRLNNLFNTHPPLEERISVLESL